MKHRRSIGPVFVVGVPRSGTTLVRMVLDSHPDIYAGPEMPWLGGNYHRTEISLRGLYDRFKHDRFSPLRAMNVKENVIKAAFRNFILTIMEEELKSQKKRIWVEKTPDNIFQVPFLKEIFPEARFIHILRDGRDVALSSVKARKKLSTLNYFIPRSALNGCKEEKSTNFLRYGGKFLKAIIPKSLKDWLGDNVMPYPRLNISKALSSNGIKWEPRMLRTTYFNALWRWKEWLKKFENDVKTLNVECLTVRYEDLVQNPYDSFRRIFQFIGVKWDPEVLNYTEKSHQVWPPDDLGSTSCLKHGRIDPHNVYKWKKELNFLQRWFTAKYFDDVLVEKGYERTLEG